MLTDERALAVGMARAQRGELDALNHRRRELGLPAVSRAELGAVEPVRDDS